MARPTKPQYEYVFSDAPDSFFWMGFQELGLLKLNPKQGNKHPLLETKHTKHGVHEIFQDVEGSLGSNFLKVLEGRLGMLMLMNPRKTLEVIFKKS